MRIAIMQKYGASRKWVFDEIRVEYLSIEYHELENSGYKLVGVEVKPS